MSITFTGPYGFRSLVRSIQLYSDNTPMIKMDDFTTIIDKADTMILQPRGLQEFVEAMFLVDAITIQGGDIGTLIMPYVPGARQDRSNVDGDVLFTAWSVADMVNQRGFSRVIVLDPHSKVTTESIFMAKEFPLERLAAKVWQGYTGIIAADKGGQARAEAFAEAMGKPIFYGAKHRDVATGRLSGFSVDALPQGGHFLVVDDICDGGGTFVGLAQEVRKQGCYADLFVTHGIFSKGTKALLYYYKNVYTTDSRSTHAHDINVIPIMEEMEAYSLEL
jgi:ribose-phosphate pyrophosphokinase